MFSSMVEEPLPPFIIQTGILYLSINNLANSIPQTPTPYEFFTNHPPP